MSLKLTDFLLFGFFVVVSCLNSRAQIITHTTTQWFFFLNICWQNSVITQYVLQNSMCFFSPPEMYELLKNAVSARKLNAEHRVSGTLCQCVQVYYCTTCINQTFLEVIIQLYVLKNQMDSLFKKQIGVEEGRTKCCL